VGSRRIPSGRGIQQTGQEKTAKRILVATDFSPACSKAIERGLTIAEQNDAALTILHVIDVNAEASLGTAADLRKGLWDSGVAKVSQVGSSLPQGVRSNTVLEEGLPWEIIAEKSRDFDLLILGRSHSQHRWKFFSPQTLERVVLNSACPVMVVDGH